MNPTILIVDDEKHTRDGLRASLEDDFEVDVAADIQGALNVLDGDQIDLVLTDLRLGRCPISPAMRSNRLGYRSIARPKSIGTCTNWARNSPTWKTPFACGAFAM